MKTKTQSTTQAQKKPKSDSSFSSGSLGITKTNLRTYVHISDMQRLMLVLMVTEYSQSCYRASKLCKIPYTNAKVIFRKFKKENRVIRTHRHYSSNQSNLRSMQEKFTCPENIAEARRKIESVLNQHEPHESERITNQFQTPVSQTVVNRPTLPLFCDESSWLEELRTIFPTALNLKGRPYFLLPTPPTVQQ